MRTDIFFLLFFSFFALNITIYFIHFKGYALWKKPQDGKQSEGLCTTSLYLQNALFFWCGGMHFLDSIRYNHNMNAIVMTEKEKCKIINPWTDDSMRKNLVKLLHFITEDLTPLCKYQIFTSYCVFQTMMSHSETLVQHLMSSSFPKHTRLITRTTCKGPFFHVRKEVLRKKNL